ncbi:MAG: ATP-binding cassette domain-containing protein [Armatimonadetes bacterium]|nr:ATP-binding cassette domain-containing protein [Armatimonadota bacterium]
MRSIEAALRAERLGKKFSRSLKHSVRYALRDIARNALGLPAPSDTLRPEEFWAVDGVSFEVRRGEVLGLIGANGSGKTTTLKLLNGILMPDRGRIEVLGRVGALIEVGAGFHPMLSGRENIYVNGAILGMSKREVDHQFDSIVAFAEIGDFLDTPVRFYSSGMYVRLGFAVAVHANPDVLLVDEVLAVGDARFYGKSQNRIRQLLEEGAAVVLVSHSMWLIQTFCTRVLLMERGRVKHEGDPTSCIYEYNKLAEVEDWVAEYSDAAQIPVVFRDVRVEDAAGAPAGELRPDSFVRVRALCRTTAREFRGRLLLRLQTMDGYPLYTSYSHEIRFREGEEREYVAEIPSIALTGGQYRLHFAICGPGVEREVLYSRDTPVDVAPYPDTPSTRVGLFHNRVEWHEGAPAPSESAAEPLEPGTHRC